MINQLLTMTLESRKRQDSCLLDEIGPVSYTHLDVYKRQPLVIRSVLPQDYHENTIAIRSSLENVRIYIGGELRAVYDTENTRPFGKNSARDVYKRQGLLQSMITMTV